MSLLQVMPNGMRNPVLSVSGALCLLPDFWLLGQLPSRSFETVAKHLKQYYMFHATHSLGLFVCFEEKRSRIMIAENHDLVDYICRLTFPKRLGFKLFSA